MAECINCDQTYFSVEWPNCSSELTEQVFDITKKRFSSVFIIVMSVVVSIGLINFYVAKFIINKNSHENATKAAAYEKQLEIQREKLRYSNGSTVNKPESKTKI